MPPTSHPEPRDPQRRAGLWRTVRLALGLATILWLSTLLSGCHPPAGPPEPGLTPFKWSVAQILPQVATAPLDTTSPGFYCASCGSDLCRQRCVASGVAVGMQNRFLLCELMPAPGVYDLGPVRRWVDANAAAGLRSIIGFVPKTDRDYSAPARGSCTAASGGSPAWMLQAGSVYQPLRNGTGDETSYHLNYRSPPQSGRAEPIARPDANPASAVRRHAARAAGYRRRHRVEHRA